MQCDDPVNQTKLKQQEELLLSVSYSQKIFCQEQQTLSSINLQREMGKAILPARDMLPDNSRASITLVQQMTASCYSLRMLSGRIQRFINSKWDKMSKKNIMFAVQHIFFHNKSETWIKWGLSVDLITSKSLFDSIRFLVFCLLQLQNAGTEVLPHACIRIY